MPEETNEVKIKNILVEKINRLIESLTADFEKNYNKKENNWIYCLFYFSSSVYGLAWL